MSEYYCKEDWKFKVYKPQIDNYDPDSPEWVSMKAFVSIQQKGKCARCRKKTTIDMLTIHHIIPRAKGGTNDIENIIGLCKKCHDIIEPQELSRDDILNYYKRRKRKEKAVKNDWHMWVYGGFSKYGIEKNKIKIPITEDTKEEKFDYPDNILLKDKYITKRKSSKYTKKYGFTFKEMMHILRITHNTLMRRLSIPNKEKEIIRILNYFR